MGKHTGMRLLDFDHSGNLNKYAKFGFTHIEYDKMLRLQGYKCACCGSETAYGNGSQRFHVDHDHVTGKVRGLLCVACNRGIGHLGDNLVGVLKAVWYLKQAEANPDIRDVPESKIPPRRKQPYYVRAVFSNRQKRYMLQYVEPNTLKRVTRGIATLDPEKAAEMARRLEERLNSTYRPRDLVEWLRRTEQTVESIESLCAAPEPSSCAG